jgi:hypothetical protein
VGWVVGILAARLLIYWLNKQRVAQGKSAVFTRRPISRTAQAGLAWFAIRALLLTLAWFNFAVDEYWLWSIDLLALGLGPLIVISFLIPLGIPSLAYYFTFVARPPLFRGDARGDAVFNELCARVYWGRGATPESTHKYTQPLIELRKGSDRAVHGSSLAARAMLDAIANDNERARELFNVVQNLWPIFAPRSVRLSAQAWLLADAAQRGAFHELLSLSKRGPRSRRRWFLGKVAQRLLGVDPAPSSAALKLAWLCAPARRLHYGLLRRALTAPRARAVALGKSDLNDVRRTTVELACAPAGTVSRARLREVATAWQQLFSENTVRTSFVVRANLLGSNVDVDELSAEVQTSIVDLLATLYRQAPADGASDETEPSLLRAAKDAIQYELLDALESACRVLPRGKSPARGELESHWRAWAKIRKLADTFFELLPERRHLVYDAVGMPLLNHGAWLFNTEKAMFVAHDIFRFLAPLAPPHSQYAATIQRNLKISR